MTSAVQHRADPFAVCLELLITGLVIILLFLGWKLVATDEATAEVVAVQASTTAETWASDFERHPVPAGSQAASKLYDQEYRLPGQDILAWEQGTTIGVLYAPRLGTDFKLAIVEGTDKHDILDRGVAGHYIGSAPLGGAGNSIITAHRSAYGSPFFNLAELRVGDPVYVETTDGWYEYRFRNSDLVDRTQVSVLKDWPDSDNLGFDHLLTLISCNPKFTAWSERLIAYTTLEKFYPRAGGAPADVQPLLDQWVETIR
ncbi:sortase [Leifsonia sp. Leaf264]|uniref:sortase n=1 Tax=Leifsonia sp. Leaf264 TaxID=1736314 RepID=UPI0006FB86B7|nr:sortase [Leifsonia sp. Leaf264]KQO98908.1 hypothetical protein ASF30_12670 [Leifsonia sp. Leaf264]